MKNFLAVVVASVLLLLAGCSEEPPDDNSGTACEDFGRAQRELSESLIQGHQNLSSQEIADIRSTAVGSMDSAGLSTTNADIKERVSDVVKSVPSRISGLAASKELAETYNRNSEAVARACDTAGEWIIVRKIPIVQYMGP